MKTWKVLPTDERYLNLTEEQREMLWEDFLMDNPNIQNQIDQEHYVDDQFDEEWEKVKEDADEGFEDDDEFSEAIENFEEFVKDNDMQVPDKSEEYTEKDKSDNDDWEEVE